MHTRMHSTRQESNTNVVYSKVFLPTLITACTHRGSESMFTLAETTQSVGLNNTQLHMTFTLWSPSINKTTLVGLPQITLSCESQWHNSQCSRLSLNSLRPIADLSVMVSPYTYGILHGGVNTRRYTLVHVHGFCFFKLFFLMGLKEF